MSLFRSFGHQHGKPYTSIVAVIALVALSVVFTTPALAAEVRQETPTPAITQLTNPRIQLSAPTLPLYTYTGAGSAVSAASPVTVPGTRNGVIRTQPALQLPAASDTPLLIMEGEASFYSRAGCLGCNPGRIMANGQPLNDHALTMAIGADKKQFVGRMARVTSLTTGKSVTVRITDTGGFHAAKYGHRVADLTLASKQAIGMAGGVGQVRVEVL